jgi:NADPH:quinone reductase-like Zn-dependent oxidoreductase
MTNAFAAAPPARQRAVLQNGYGAPRQVLTLRDDLPIPSPAATQIQMAVHAASINPIDGQMIEGNRTLMIKRRFPFTPLFDLAGVVTAVGKDVRRFKIGDAVHADNQIDGGGASEYVCVDQHLVSHKPSSLSFAEAAAMPLAGQTALLALDRAEVGPGSRVAVIGASGGVGSLAVQMAKARGAAHVVGVCSARNADFVRSLGADEVVDYTRVDLAKAIAPRSLDIVIDCVGGKNQWLSAKVVLRAGGNFTTISRDEDGKMTVPSLAKLGAGYLARQAASHFGARHRYIAVFLDASGALLDRVNAFVEAGTLRVPVSATYPFSLEGVVAGLEASRAGRVVGKSVVIVRP